MLQRLLIARALLTRPRLLLLDEPTRSLDPISAREFRTFLRDELARERGCAVILATHNAEEAFELCDRVAVLDHGRLLASGVAEHLSREFMGVRYRLTTTQPDHPAIQELRTHGIEVSRLQATGLRPEAIGGAEAQISGHPLPDEWHDLVLQMKPDHDPAGVLSMLVSHGMRIAVFEPVRPSLADLIEGVVRRGNAS
jgi:ABC-type multidrug transport system ATPase subunit